MFNDKLQPIYDGRVLVNQTAMDNPVVKAALAEMSQRNFDPQRIQDPNYSQGVPWVRRA